MTSGGARKGLHGTHGISAGLSDLDKQRPLLSRAKPTAVEVGADTGPSPTQLGSAG